MTAWRESLEKVTSRIVPGAGGFWAWWRRSLLAWLPVRWQMLLGVSDARLLLSPQSDGLHIYRVMQDQFDRIGRTPMPASEQAVDALVGPRFPALPHHWLLASSAALRRRLLLPAAAEARLRDVMGFEIDRQTPFTLEQVYFDARVLAHRADGQLDVELVAVPKAQVDVLSQVGNWDAGLDGVDVADGAGIPLGVNLLPVAHRRQRPNPMRLSNLVLMIATLLVLAAAAWQLLDNRRSAVAALRAKVEADAGRARGVSAQRQQLQDLVDGAAFLESQRMARPAAVAVMNELSQRLPDGTWLEKLSLEGKGLQLVGFSNSASTLVSQLEGSALWQTPALTGVLQADSNRGGDRFTLTAVLQGSPKETADDAAAQSP